MKLTIERTALLTSLSHVQSVVERRNTIPILANILMDARDGFLGLTATDLDIAINEKVAANIDAEGATTIPAHLLYDIIRKLPEGSQVELDYKAAEERIYVRSGQSKFALACLPQDDFPVMETNQLPHNFVLSGNILKRLIDKTRFAISTEETRYYLNGIYLHTAETEGVPMLRAVATDGHRLARVETPVPSDAEGMPGVIVPRKAVSEVLRLIDERDEPVSISLSETKICFSFGDTILTSKLIDGTFPDYERVIPAGNDKVLELDGKSFAQAVDRVSTVATEKTRAIKLSLSNDLITLSATGAEAGSATEEVAATYSADEMEIGFNSKYLLDITGQIDGENARFLFADAGSPTIVRDSADEGALYVLMPMRV
ncbi:DNA polymerase III subunit beta [Sneathiella sp. CAU 1612]|uniref:Beta sliding clamp n=1 Tax=Sneathiella sedimenti TaxID=2816034 RepID=A0ABS3F2H1_9PROT|nr:DNA polymerase III subunit beta [Sneathiella sedimenti]MBO0332715.1 DNA polymerase III subunit beta [Sneathiella sedimenti]